MKLDELRMADARLATLRKISRRLHSLHEAACNYGLSERQEKRESRLKDQAEGIAELFSFGIYFQDDPRGCAIYLIPREWTGEYASSNYPSGMAIY